MPRKKGRGQQELGKSSHDGNSDLNTQNNNYNIGSDITSFRSSLTAALTQWRNADTEADPDTDLLISSSSTGLQGQRLSGGSNDDSSARDDTQSDTFSSLMRGPTSAAAATGAAGTGSGAGASQRGHP